MTTTQEYNTFLESVNEPCTSGSGFINQPSAKGYKKSLRWISSCVAPILLKHNLPTPMVLHRNGIPRESMPNDQYTKTLYKKYGKLFGGETVDMALKKQANKELGIVLRWDFSTGPAIEDVDKFLFHIFGGLNMYIPPGSTGEFIGFSYYVQTSMTSDPMEEPWMWAARPHAQLRFTVYNKKYWFFEDFSELQCFSFNKGDFPKSKEAEQRLISIIRPGIELARVCSGKDAK